MYLSKAVEQRPCLKYRLQWYARKIISIDLIISIYLVKPEVRRTNRIIFCA